MNIGPLIAGAGIVGVALGFGAQTLVRDFLSGIFMLFEDQYGIGDVVDLGDATGTVEAVTLRVTRLRDVNGTVWYVRNGEILRVGNMSQNWARTVLDVPVGYGEDLDPGAADPRGDRATTCGRTPTSAARSWRSRRSGASSGIDPDAVVRPGRHQDRAARAVGRSPASCASRIKERFGHEGIEIPFPQQVVWHRESSRQARAGPAGSTRSERRRRRRGSRVASEPAGRSGQRGVQGDRGAGQRLRHRAVLLGVLGGAWKSSALMPSTVPTTVRWMPVMPSPGWNVTSACTSSAVGGRVRPWRGAPESAIEKHDE